MESPAFPIAGIGASAGGLEAFTNFLEHLPTETGIGFVFIQHLDPKRESLLRDLLARATALPVIEVDTPMAVQPNHVYTIPPNADVEIAAGILTPRFRSPDGGHHLTIDHFLRSLAQDQRSHAIGALLSGTGSDGALGLKAIKGEGGITFAQDEKSAKHDGMPRTAIAMGCVDFVMTPAEMAREMARIGRHPYIAPAKAASEEAAQTLESDDMANILRVVRSDTGVDLKHYKRSTLERRILRRMALLRLEKAGEYIKRLSVDPAEVHALYEDCLINVTQFFRDPVTFEALQRDIFPRLAAERARQESIRFWIPGCSTGEEAYSLAISLLEYLDGLAPNQPIQIFGTDISDAALEKARLGVYPESISIDISPERLRRFFLRVENGYQINRRVRDCCIFAKHNLAKDPPFPRLDLISCRNVLIYMGPVLQKKIMPVFHYALKPNGILLLGNSESVGAFGDLFSVADKKHKIFAKKIVSSRMPVDFTYRPWIPEGAADRPKRTAAGEYSTEIELQREADRIVLSHHSPVGVIISEDMDILQFRGQTSPYLEPPAGPATLNILKMAREGLRGELRSAIHHVKISGSGVRKENLRLYHDGHVREFSLEVMPLKRTSAGRSFLVLFHAGKLRNKKSIPLASTSRKSKPEWKELSQLQNELASVKESLQSTIEEQEASNEELRSANEEIQSANEELQSTNEELETAKEELQSSNEELNTVNEELETRNSELSQANNDLRNLLTSVNIPIIMVGNDLRLRRFTPLAEKVLNLIPGDIGRPISNIKSNLNVPDMERLLRDAIDTLRVYEANVQDSNGRWYAMRIRPYKTEDNKIEGAVLTLVETDPANRSAQDAEETRDFAQTVVETVRSPMVVLDGDFSLRAANYAFYQTFDLTVKGTTGKLVFDLDGDAWNLPELHTLLESELPRRRNLRDIELDHEWPRVGRKVLLLNARRLYFGAAASQIVVLSFEDITQRISNQELPAPQATAAEVKHLDETDSELRALTSKTLKAQEEESRRVSLELHDVLNQKIAMLEVGIHALEHKLPPAQKTIRKALEILRGHTSELSNDVRRMAYQLHPSIVDDLGLEVAMRSFATEFAKQEGIRVKFAPDRVPRSLPHDMALNLYRLLQEGLHNVAKHAHTERVTIGLVHKDGHLHLSIRDYGTGFDPEGVKGKGGLGLPGMQQRVRMINGSFEIHSTATEGTVIDVKVPLPPEPDS